MFSGHIDHHVCKQTDTPTAAIDSRRPLSLGIMFGCITMRSQTHKVFDVLEMRCHRHFDVFCLTETWRDSNSVMFNRLPRRRSPATWNVKCRWSIDQPWRRYYRRSCLVCHQSGFNSVSDNTWADCATLLVVRKFNAVVVVVCRPGSATTRPLSFFLGHRIRCCHHYWRNTNIRWWPT